MKAEFPQAELESADIQNSMKSLVALFAGEISGYALEPLAGGMSAFEKSVVWAQKVPNVERIVVFSSSMRADRLEIPQWTGSTGGNIPYEICNEPNWTIASFFERLALESGGVDHIFLSWADCPFLDAAFSDELYKKHIKYAAEYSFADGYPYGLSPEILARGILPILSAIAKENTAPVTRNAVFETIKKDINSFDIETDIAPVDLRQLRLSLSCDTKRNTMLCNVFTGINAVNYGDLIQANSSKVRTLPAFYAVQVAGKCPFECIYCPYPQFCRSGTGISPGKPATARTDEMPLEQFRTLVGKIASFSEDAVISLSLWGESAYHSDILSLVRCVLAYPSLSVLIETTGIGWKRGIFEEIAAALDMAVPRTNGHQGVSWIVSLDAVGSEQYGLVHGIPKEEKGNVGSDTLLREALSCMEKLAFLFPGAVWPQMVRMNDNEVELESFYRFWKQKLGQVIIQKHDHFCMGIEDRRVADLSPLVRHPCWHIKRDMSILLDGSVPLCREDLYALRSFGNAFKDDLSTIWARQQGIFEQHCEGVYEGMCGACDEYYTYNF